MGVNAYAPFKVTMLALATAASNATTMRAKAAPITIANHVSMAIIQEMEAVVSV